MRLFIIFLSIFYCISPNTNLISLAHGSDSLINTKDAIIKSLKGEYMDAFLDFEILAAQGDVIAQLHLGTMYREGVPFGVPDFDKARKWLTLSAESGNAIANQQLGWMYAKAEIGDARDYSKAVKYWEAAARLGNTYAQSDLGIMYWRGDGIERDLLSAYAWIFLASKSEVETAAKANLEFLIKEMDTEQIQKAKDIALKIEDEIEKRISSN